MQGGTSASESRGCPSNLLRIGSSTCFCSIVRLCRSELRHPRRKFSREGGESRMTPLAGRLDFPDIWGFGKISDHKIQKKMVTVGLCGWVRYAWVLYDSAPVVFPTLPAVDC